jgi:hypothetical protein
VEQRFAARAPAAYGFNPLTRLASRDSKASEGEGSHTPTAADIAIAESEAEYEAFKGEGMAQLVRARGPQVLAPRTEEQKLRDERIALERRRRAAGW